MVRSSRNGPVTDDDGGDDSRAVVDAQSADTETAAEAASEKPSLPPYAWWFCWALPVLVLGISLAVWYAPRRYKPPPLACQSQPRGTTATVPPLTMGPLVGHTTHESATIWAYHEYCDYGMDVLVYRAKLSVVVNNASLPQTLPERELIRRISNLAPDPDRHNAFFHTLTGLVPSTSYSFELQISSATVGSGSFRTAPAPSESRTRGSRFDYVLASCLDASLQKRQPVWEAIPQKLGQTPDFILLAGDTIYLKGADLSARTGVRFDRYWFRSLQQRSIPSFANFVASVPTYGTWNNHDYGTWNAHKGQAGKEHSKHAWKSLWANPERNADAQDDGGIYYSFYWGDVHYIVTDDHWYRDPSKGNRLGTEQTAWIERELKDSTGTFKVLVMGSDIMQRGWRDDLTNLGRIVTQHAIDGVLFHAGDIHRNEYKEQSHENFPYKVKQITSSGIAKVWRKPWAHVAVDTTRDDPTMTARFYGATANAPDTDWANDPELECTSVPKKDRTKEHACTQTLYLSDLTVSGKRR